MKDTNQPPQDRFRGEIEKILWKHYEPDSSPNMEEVTDEIMSLLSSYTQDLRGKMIKEILEMKRVAVQEKEAISPMGIISITHDMGISPAIDSTVRNLVYVKVHDIVRYAENNGISILSSLLTSDTNREIR